MTGPIDKLKSAGEQATASARVSLHEAELRRDLDRAYSELGRTTYDLVEDGTVTDQRLVAGVDRVRELDLELATVTRPTRRNFT